MTDTDDMWNQTTEELEELRNNIKSGVNIPDDGGKINDLKTTIAMFEDIVPNKKGKFKLAPEEPGYINWTSDDNIKYYFLTKLCPNLVNQLNLMEMS